MDGGAWWAVVHGLQRVRHNLATKQQQHNLIFYQLYYFEEQANLKDDGFTIKLHIIHCCYCCSVTQ